MAAAWLIQDPTALCTSALFAAEATPYYFSFGKMGSKGESRIGEGGKRRKTRREKRDMEIMRDETMAIYSIAYLGLLYRQHNRQRSHKLVVVHTPVVLASVCLLASTERAGCKLKLGFVVVHKRVYAEGAVGIDAFGARRHVLVGQVVAAVAAVASGVHKYAQIERVVEAVAVGVRKRSQIEQGAESADFVEVLAGVVESVDVGLSHILLGTFEAVVLLFEVVDTTVGGGLDCMRTHLGPSLRLSRRRGVCFEPGDLGISRCSNKEFGYQEYATSRNLFA